MNEKEVLTEAEERRLGQSSLLSAFEEIAQTFLTSVSGKSGSGKVLTSLQDYLDDSVLINGAYYRRRTVLLAIHDMKEELEAPSALRSKVLAKLELLNLRPVPQVIFYHDIATAILRMEVVVRLKATRAPDGSASGAVGHGARFGLAALLKFRAIGYGLAAAACSIGAVTFLNGGSVGDLHNSAPIQLAYSGAGIFMDAKWRAGDCIRSLNRDMGKPIDGNTCTPGASLVSSQRKFPVNGNSLGAPESMMFSALAEAGLGSVPATPSGGASPAREIPSHSSWATSVEAK